MKIDNATNIEVRAKRIAADDGCLLYLQGVREIVWDEANGLQVLFAPGGSVRAAFEGKWIPTRRVQQ